MTSSLLSRLQALTEPSREIDAEIALANGWTRINGAVPSLVGPFWRGPNGEIQPSPPRYTASIDAAMTLTEERRWNVGAYGNGYAASVGFYPYPTLAPTPAIALCIAALKAKEESKP